MNHFDYVRPASIEEALTALRGEGSKILAGGTNLVDLLKYEVAQAAKLVDINGLPLTDIEKLPDGGLRLGALATNADTAYHPFVQERAPLVSSAILAGASAQLRNVATNGGNLLQRTRCFYFYDVHTPCNKREPGSGCPAIGGISRMHAILGASEHCIAVHPSDFCVALAALGASINVIGPEGERVIPMTHFHRLPGETPQRDTTLGTDELIVSIDLPRWPFGPHYSYLKIRDRLSYAFALVSVGAALEIANAKILSARIALGGVAHKPWRSLEAEALLVGQSAGPEAFGAAADMLLAGATAFDGNRFKIDLARRAIVRALTQAAGAAPQSQSDKRVQ